jgi:hypothetical protein
MSRFRNWLILAIIVVCAAVWFTLAPAFAGAQQPIVLPSGDEVRFELLGNEPIAGPDGRALVSGWSVLMFRDRRVNKCYVVIKNDAAIAMEEAACAPPK